MASAQAGAGFDAGMTAEDGSDPLPKSDPKRVYNVQPSDPQGDLARGASTMPSPSYSSSSSLVAADLAPAKPPTSAIVVYFREPSDSLPLSAFLDSLLDPPRVA